jgi:Undecaprenyl-phosphate glucose phosphotransferase
VIDILAAHTMPTHTMVGSLAVAVICYFGFFQPHLYDLDSLLDEARALKAIALRWTVVFILLAALAILIHQPSRYSWPWLLGFYGAGLLGLAAGRAAVGGVMRTWIARGYPTRTVAIVGTNDLAEQLIGRLESNRFGIRVVGVFDDGGGEAVANIRGVPRLGGIGELVEYTRLDLVDTVIITLPVAAKARLDAVVRELRQHPVTVRLLPGAIGLDRLGGRLRLARSEVPGVQLLVVGDRPISEVALVAKGVIDRLAAGLGVLLLAPVLLACAVGIRLSSPGPVLFRQRRVGYNGREFDIFKFRTMHVAARPDLRLTARDDPRVFGFGALLRRSSLDELPQLFNVLKGDMSLVGPRPHMPEARAAGLLYFKAVNEYASRHRVKPGITGWAQVNGWRGPTETIEQIERRVEYDIYSIDNWSILFDFLIILKTFVIIWNDKNAF